MTRITWLDVCRGLAIILLVAMHYIGALESRKFISLEALHVIYGVLRLATPFFIFMFGVSFYITASKRINKLGVKSYYKNHVLKRLGYILIGRELIVLILSLRYPSMAENLWSVLLFQQFSHGGEILIFYFFALMLAPLNYLFLSRVKVSTYVFFWLGVYFISYYIGANFLNSESNNILRILFYDIYPLFPYLFVVAVAMLIAKNFIVSENQRLFIIVGLGIGGVMVVTGFLYLNILSDDIWKSLALAEYKSPPSIGYMLFYLGEVFIVICLIALTSYKIPIIVHNALSLLGRNTLVAYVMHYSFFVIVPVAAMLGGGTVYELVLLICICSITYLGIYLWDTRKQNNKLKQHCSQNQN